LAEKLVLGVDFDLNESDRKIDKLQKTFNSLEREIRNNVKATDDLDQKIEDINSKESAYNKLQGEIKKVTNNTEELELKSEMLRNSIAAIRAEYSQGIMPPEEIAQVSNMKNALRDAGIQISKNKDLILELNSKVKDTAALTQQEITLRDDLVARSATFRDRQQEIIERQKAIGEELRKTRMDPKSFEESGSKLKTFLKNVTSIKGYLNDIKGWRVFQRFNKDIDESGGKLNRVKAAFSGIKNKIKEVGSTQSKVTAGVGQFANRISALAKRVFVFTVITKALRAVQKQLLDMLKTNSQFSTSLTQIKGNLLTAFQPIYQLALPAINSLMNLLKKASAYLAAFTNALFGKSLSKSAETAKAIQAQISSSGSSGSKADAKEIDGKIKALKKEIKAYQDANKELKALQKAEQALVDAQKTDIDQQIKGLQQQNKQLKEQQKQREAEVKAQSKAVDDQISGLKDQIKAIKDAEKARIKARDAEKKSLASFDSLNILSGDETDPEAEAAEARIAALEDEIALLNERKDLILDIEDDPRIAQNEEIIDQLKAQKDAIDNIDYSAQIDANNAMIDSLKAQIDLLNDEQQAIKEAADAAAESGAKWDTYFDFPGLKKFQEKIAELKERFQPVVDALKAIGATIWSAVKPAFEWFLEDMLKPLFKWLTSEDTIKWLTDKLEKLQEWFENNKEKITQFVKVALTIGLIIGVVMGVIKAVKALAVIFSALTSPIGLVVLAIAAIVTIAGNAEEMIDHLKMILSGFKDLLVGIFTGDVEKMKEGAMKILVGLGNALIVILESLVKVLADALNWFVDKVLNGAIGWIGDKLGQDWGNIPKIPTDWSFPRIPIPQLARGAVLPGGKPFLAMLGDQPAGQTNLEAPEGLIRRIVREEAGGEREIKVIIEFTGDGAQLVRWLAPEIEVEQRRRSAFA